MRRSPTPPLTANQKGALTIAGLALGQLIVIVIDHVTHGPGPFVLFGL